MESQGRKYIFGPVASRRLGRSLGVDIVPRKVCTLDCVYCQVGRTTDQRVERGDFVPVEDVIRELRETLAVVPRPDYVTISGSGEPTLNWRLGEIIDAIRAATDVPVAIITNGTLLGQAAVRQDCAKADLVCPSLDAGDEETFRRVNRPAARPAGAAARGITLQALVDGLIEFRNEYRGKFWLEVFLVAGLNDSDEQVEKIRRLVERIRPDRVQLNTATRPTAEPDARAVPPERLAQIAALLGPKAEVITSPPSRRAGPAARLVEAEEILALIRRRPVTAEDIAAGLGAQPTEVAKLLGELLAARRIKRSTRAGQTFYESAEKP